MADGANGTKNEQKYRVDDIAHDDRLLESKMKELTGNDVRLAPNNVEVHDLDSVDWDTACALLVRIDGAAGAVYVHGNKLDIVMTGADRGPGWWLIVLEPGQSCRFYGQPSVRYFRRSA
ncbi:hypothetical protein MW887_008620 [Aspergillus wentii]|nr:hypothetical protein MW887_008620 [Aspergillus wentii]